MADNNQDKINFTLETALGEDILSVASFEGFEEISRGFRYSLNVYSTDGELPLIDVVGKPATLNILRPGETPVWVSGIVTRFSQTSSASDLTNYRLVIEPWTWFLTHRSNCRIFQEMTIPDIIKDIFDTAGFAGKYIDELSESYSAKTYCVQYRETDFNFVSRLMAQEGIYYYFRYDDGEHKLVFTDSINQIKPIPEEEMPYLLSVKESGTDEGITVFKAEQSIRPGTVTLREYDFQQPSAPQEVMFEQGEGTELYDYPGKYDVRDDGEKYAKVKLEAAQFDAAVYYGQANTRRFTCGRTFTLINFPTDSINISYLLLNVSIRGEQGEHDSTFTCNFKAISAEVPFRPRSTAVKPLVNGIQTAMVVGPDNEEIHVDKYGRIKVQFHWDREGTYTDKSSCWVRVAQGVAGKNWGTIYHPRIGQEVVVQFIEGDIDRPLVTGSLYNEEHMPPYELPANASQSTIKTRSTKEGGPENFNEIRFEDLKDSEHLLIHAEKDFMREVENDETITVGNNRSKTVSADETVSVSGGRTKSIGGDETTTVSGNRTETVETDETITVSGNRTETISGDETISLEKNRSLTIGENDTVDVGKELTVNVGKNETVDVGKVLTITAGDEITLKSGMASITMKKDGTIEISGKEVTISAMMNLTAEGKMGAKVTGMNVDVSGQVAVNVKGAMVNLN